MRDELLDRELFRTLTEARVVINGWLVEYNTFRPHRALGMKPPAVFAAGTRAQLKEAKREGVGLVTNVTQTGPEPGSRPAAGTVENHTDCGPVDGGRSTVKVDQSTGPVSRTVTSLVALIIGTVVLGVGLGNV
jgi:hypothetical protein